MNIEDLYLKSPVWIQQMLINAQGLKIANTRFNKNFNFWLNKYQSSDALKINEDQLYLFLTQAVKTEFWKRKFEQYDVTIDSPANLISELSKLPVLSKQEVKSHINEISNLKVNDRISFNHTSGTTGSGLIFPQTRQMENKQWAIWWRYRGWYGLNTTTWMGWFGGRSIACIEQRKPPYWRVNYPMHQVRFSAHHLNEETVALYFNEIKSRKLTWLHGYPSQPLEKHNIRFYQ